MAPRIMRAGSGRTRISFEAKEFGDATVVYLYNGQAHIGAVAVGDYDFVEERASTSVITRLGHKDDAIAVKAAHAISKITKKPSCVIVGIHVDNATSDEIDAFLKNAEELVSRYLRLSKPRS